MSSAAENRDKRLKFTTKGSVKKYIHSLSYNMDIIPVVNVTHTRLICLLK